MTCALTHDDPVDDCRDRSWIPVVVAVIAVVGALALLAIFLVRARRRRRAENRSASDRVAHTG